MKLQRKDAWDTMIKNQSEIISKMSIIELFISRLIAQYTCKKSQKNVMLHILKSTSTTNKLRVLQHIIDENKSIGKHAYQQIRKDIEHLVNKRNLYAHSLMVLPKLSQPEIDYFEFHNLSNIKKKNENNIVECTFHSHKTTMEKGQRVLDAIIAMNGVKTK